MKRELIEALRFAVDGEIRFGRRDDVREELEGRWEDVIALLEELCQKPKPKKT